MRKFVDSVRHSDLIRHNMVMLTGTLFVSAINYLFYPIIGRLLHVDQLGEVQVIISLTTQLMFVLSIGRIVILNVIANETDNAARQRFMLQAERAVIRTALGLSLIVLMVSPLIKHFLQLQSILPLLLLIPIILLSAIRGTRDAYLRSLLLFRQSVVSDAIVSVLRIVFAVALTLLSLGTFGAIGGFVVALAISAIYMNRTSRASGLKLSPGHEFSLGGLREQIDTKLMRPHLKYAIAVSAVGLMQTLMVVMDAVTAKHYFPPKEAGLYAGISIVGNIVLFATGSFSNVLIASVKTTIPHKYNVKKLAISLAMLLTVGVVIASIFAAFPAFIIQLLLGSRYTVYAELLPRVAITMLLLSVANLIFTYHLALRDYKVTIMAIASISLMFVSVVVAHDTLSQMVNSILFASVIVVVVNSARTCWWNIRQLRRVT